MTHDEIAEYNWDDGFAPIWPVPPIYSVLVAGKGLTRFECSSRIGYDELSQIQN